VDVVSCCMFPGSDVAPFTAADRPIQHTSALMRTVLLIRMFAGRVVNDLTPEYVCDFSRLVMGVLPWPSDHVLDW